jgi:hypothetical protein
MVRGGGNAHDAQDEVPVVILSTPPPLVKDPSNQSMLPRPSPSIESLDLATQSTKKRGMQRTRTASANGGLTRVMSSKPDTSTESEKKSKVRSMLDVLSTPFKLKTDQAHSAPISNLKPSGGSHENLATEKENKNKKDCSVAVKGTSIPLHHTDSFGI